MDGSELTKMLESAEAFLRAARFDDALAEVCDWPEWPAELGQYAALIVAEVKLRLDAAQSLAFLAPLEDLFSIPEAKFKRALTLARAYGIVRSFDAAQSYVERAASLLDEYPAGSFSLALVKARLRVWRNERLLDDPDLAYALTDPSPRGRLLAYTQRAWVYAANQDYQSQIADLILALDTLFTSGPASSEISTAATAGVSLARIAFETAHEEGIAVATRALEMIPWTPVIAEQHMHMLQCLGLDAFMRGESGRAQWLFRDALALAPSPAFRAECHLDRALVARIGGNEPWALDEIFEAERESANVAWGDTFGEERMILSIFAEMYAPVDTGRAHYYAAAYSRLGLANIKPDLGMNGDKRAAALDLHARGLIEQTLGDRGQATKTFSSVYATFDEIGHHFRAARAAISLFTLTGSAEWAARAREHIAAYGPDCPLGVSLEAKESSPEAGEPGGLTPFQRQLLRALINGEDLDRISKRFSRSSYTISKQVEYIYGHLGVSSVQGLRREAERKGIA